MKATIQFRCEGEVVGNPFIVPEDIGHSGLKDLFSTISQQEENNGIEFSFIVNQRVVANNLLNDCLSGTGVSLEGVLVVDCIKTSSFQVKPVTRTSSALSGHQGPVLCCQFTSDASVLASGSGDKTVRLWDTSTGTPIKIMTGHSGFILALSWSPDNNLLASGDSEGLICVWRRNGDLVCKLAGHKKWVTCISWKPIRDSTELVSSSKDGTCRLWNIVRAVCDICLSHSDSVTCVRWFTPDKIVSVSHDRRVRLWDSSGKLEKMMLEHAHWINSISTNMDYANRLKEDSFFNGKVSGPNTVVFATSSDDFTINMIKDDLSSIISKCNGHQGVVNHVAFSPNGEMIASASFDKSIKIWCGKSGRFIGNLRGHVGAVYQLCWSADSKYLLSCSKDATAKLWDIKTLKLKCDLPGHKDEVYCVDWAPRGEFAASGGKDQKILIWRN